MAVVAQRPCPDQRRGGLLALDQDHVGGRLDAGPVVERTRIGRLLLAREHVPGPELLAAGRIVAVDAGDQPARLVEIVPLGGDWTELVDGRRLATGSARALVVQGPGAAVEPGQDVGDDGGELGLRVAAVRRRPEPDDVAALAGGEVVPQAGLAALDLDHEAVAGVAVDVADEELAPLEHAARKEVGEDAADMDQHARLDLIGALDGVSGPGVVERWGSASLKSRQRLISTMLPVTGASGVSVFFVCRFRCRRSSIRLDPIPNVPRRPQVFGARPLVGLLAGPVGRPDQFSGQPEPVLAASPHARRDGFRAARPMAGVRAHGPVLQQRSDQGQKRHSWKSGDCAMRGSSSPASVALIIRTPLSLIRCASAPSNGTGS